MRVRDAGEADLPAIVRIYNSAVSTRNSTADTEPVSVESRREWFRGCDPKRRPVWVMEANRGVIGWLSLSDFYDGRPAYHATAEIGVYVTKEHRGKGVATGWSRKPSSVVPNWA